MEILAIVLIVCLNMTMTVTVEIEEKRYSPIVVKLFEFIMRAALSVSLYLLLVY